MGTHDNQNKLSLENNKTSSQIVLWNIHWTSSSLVIYDNVVWTTILKQRKQKTTILSYTYTMFHSITGENRNIKAAPDMQNFS